jgi:hypothetical protein
MSAGEAAANPRIACQVQRTLAGAISDTPTRDTRYKGADHPFCMFGLDDIAARGLDDDVNEVGNGQLARSTRRERTIIVVVAISDGLNVRIPCCVAELDGMTDSQNYSIRDVHGFLGSVSSG